MKDMHISAHFFMPLAFKKRQKGKLKQILILSEIYAYLYAICAYLPLLHSRFSKCR